MPHHAYIKRCLELAQRAKGYPAPNPMVGALLEHEGTILAEGWHQHYGGNHAEVNCFNNVATEHRHLLKDSTLYVNLEPCVHHGNTPPCAERIINEGVKKVVIANKDPFEKVSGKGIDMLEQAGIAVENGIMEAEGKWVNRRFFCCHEQKRPYIILKWAQTKDGYIAPADRSKFHITNELSARMLHKWRVEEAAIMVGTATALYDNPMLTSRLWKGKQPLRIVLDRTLKVPESHYLYNDAAPTWVVNEARDGMMGNITFVKTDFGNDLLTEVLDRMYDAKIISLIVEGGAILLNSFIKKGLWDEARIFTGDTMLQNGIAAPLLTDAVPALSIPVLGDQLQVFANKYSHYTYTQGMEL